MPTFSKALTLAALLVATTVALASFESAAQQPSADGNVRNGPNGPHRGPAIGGTSLTLSDIWGPAKMPPPANDFGPGFDYPGTYTLDGAPNHAPYPN
jgi:hypothetical protein